MKPDESSVFSFHPPSLDLRLRRNKKRRPLSKARATNPPTTPPTIPPILGSLPLCEVCPSPVCPSPPVCAPCSGAMTPTGPLVGLPTVAELDCERSAAIDVASGVVCEDDTVCSTSGTAATDVGFEVPADSVTTGCATGVVVDDSSDDDGGPITAVLILSELVGAILAGGSVGAAATCEETTGSLDCEGALGVETSDAGAEG